MIVGPHSTKLPQSWDTGSDQPSVPAISISALQVSCQWQPAKPRNRQVDSIFISFLHCCRNLASYFIILFGVQLHQNLLQSKDVESIPRTEFHDGSTNFSCQVYWIVFCTYDAFHNRKFAMMFLSKCVIPAVYVKLAGTLRGKALSRANCGQ